MTDTQAAEMPEPGAPEPDLDADPTAGEPEVPTDAGHAGEPAPVVPDTSAAATARAASMPNLRLAEPTLYDLLVDELCGGMDIMTAAVPGSSGPAWYGGFRQPATAKVRA